jgi:hypothetical protein
MKMREQHCENSSASRWLVDAHVFSGRNLLILAVCTHNRFINAKTALGSSWDLEHGMRRLKFVRGQFFPDQRVPVIIRAISERLS